jgi:hypothetical protein
LTWPEVESAGDGLVVAVFVGLGLGLRVGVGVLDGLGDDSA